MTEARRVSLQRETKETKIELTLNIDGSGVSDIKSGVGFLDHLLDSFARHGLFDLTIKANGDLHIDEHHTVEDIAIVLGRAIAQALGDRRGLRRAGHSYMPLDEALAFVAVDCSGRGYAVVDVSFTRPMLGALGTDLIKHFLETVALEGHLNLNARLISGENDHHKAEALFKAFARALDMATQVDPRLGDAIPSTKGTLSA